MTNSCASEAAVRAHLDRWLQASRDMDIDALRACYLPDVVSYDCHSAFEFRGIDAYSNHLAACFSHMVAPATIEMHELSIAVDDQLAFCHLTLRCGCRSKAGSERWSWLRSTVCMKKVGDHWLIVHDHCSAPFDPMSSQAMLDAGPEELKKVA